MWYDQAVLYQIYPLGLCGAPLVNGGDAAQAEQVPREGGGAARAQVLADAGVYKQDEAGLAGMKRFLATLGYQA